MVKGNWQRRAELANLKRAAAKAKKQGRCSSTPSPESVITKLTRFPELADSNIYVWLSTQDDRLICSAFFRGDCSNRKCKQSHSGVETIGKVRNVKYPEDGVESEPFCTRFELKEISPKDYSYIRLIVVDGFCVYDDTDSEIWLNWLSEKLRSNMARVSIGDVELKEVDEEYDETNDSGTMPVEYLQAVDKMHVESFGSSEKSNIFCELHRSITDIEIEENGEIEFQNEVMKEPFCLFLEIHHSFLGEISTYCSDHELFNLLCCSKSIKSAGIIWPISISLLSFAIRSS
jgi:hypothetical protein